MATAAKSVRRRPTRQKISTTVAPETLAYLERLIKGGQAYNLAEALDLLVREKLAEENRATLEAATAAYYESLTPEQAAEEHAWEVFAERAGAEIDVDREP